MFSNGIESKVSRLAALLVVLAIRVPCAAARRTSDLRCEWRVNNEAVRDMCPELY